MAATLEDVLVILFVCLMAFLIVRWLAGDQCKKDEEQGVLYGKSHTLNSSNTTLDETHPIRVHTGDRLLVRLYPGEDGDCFEFYLTENSGLEQFEEDNVIYIDKPLVCFRAKAKGMCSVVVKSSKARYTWTILIG